MTVEIPLQIINLDDDGFHLLVEVVVYGQKYLAVVDTGASKTAFDEQILKLADTGVLIIETDRL